MEARKTILNDEQIQKAKAEAERLSWTHKPHPIFEKEKYLLEAQAEILFKAGRKAGIREVVEWIERNAGVFADTIEIGGLSCVGKPLERRIDYNKWEVKLKEWNEETKGD